MKKHAVCAWVSSLLVSLCSPAASASPPPPGRHLPAWVAKGSGIEGRKLTAVGSGSTLADALARALCGLAALRSTTVSVQRGPTKVIGSAEEHAFGKALVSCRLKDYSTDTPEGVSKDSLVTETLRVTLTDGAMSLIVEAYAQERSEGDKQAESAENVRVQATNASLSDLLAELRRVGLEITTFYDAADGERCHLKLAQPLD